MAVSALPLDKRWLLGNRVKRLAWIRRGSVTPTRSELNIISSFVNDPLEDVRASLPAIDWEAVSECGSATRTLRDAMGCTRAELADMCSVDVSALSRIENGRTLPNRSTAARLANLARQAAAPENVVLLFGVRNPDTDEALRLLGALTDLTTLKPDAVVDGLALGRWLVEVKRSLEAGTCEEGLRASLFSLGVKSRRDLWMERYEDLASRPDSGVLVFPRSDALEPWVSDQRRAHAAGSLPRWKKDLLEAVPGWRWGCSKQDQWMASYHRVKAAVIDEGVTVLHRSWVTKDGFPAGDWVARARKRASSSSTRQDAQRMRYLASLPDPA